MEDFRKYYNLESYLFDAVRHRFAEQGYLNAFDFFCIVIWKANRAKSKIARKLQNVCADLEMAVSALTYGLTRQPDAKDRLHFLCQAGFDLPMASSILTVLYPDEFTVYDQRVCGVLGDFHKLKDITDFEKLWDGYQKFKRSVEGAAPSELILRDKDRYLWGKSFYDQLTNDIKRGFLEKGD
jgi:hypothetical protein